MFINYDKNGKITGQFANKQYDGQVYTDFVINDDNINEFKVVDGVVENISETPEYLAKKLQSGIQYQHDAFNEYAREIVYQIQYNTALSNTTLILDLEEQLQTEQQAVIVRINAITEAYNNAST